MIEAMKQALEALESATPKYTRQRADQKTLGGALDYWKLEQHQRLKAITSLRQAIAEAEKQEPVQVAIKDFVKAVDGKEEMVGRPVYWAQWPNDDTHPQPKREPPTPLEVKDVLRATGLLTNSQAWDVAEEVMKLLAAHGVTSDMKQEHVDKTAK
jgi:hypothetical protein